MKVAKLKISQFAGIEELEIEPGAITTLSGGNRKGKTSVLNALKAVVQSGSDASLIRNGAEEAVVVLEMDDGMEIRRRITPKGSTVSVRHPEFGVLAKPQTILDGLLDSVSANPVAFLDPPGSSEAAKRRARLELFLEALPVRLTQEQLEEALAEVFEPEHAGDLDRHALEVLADLRKRYYEDRTDVNRAAKERRATINQLQESLPQDGVEEPSARIQELQSERDAIEEEENQARDALLAEVLEAEDTCDKRLAERLEELRQLEREAREAHDVQVRQIGRDRAARSKALDEEFDARLRTIDEELAGLQERQKEAERHQNTRRIVEDLTREAVSREEASEALTAAIQSVDQLKAGLLKDLPIEGLEVRADDLYLNDVPFESLSTSEQVGLALAVAMLRAGKLGLIWVDGLECLDEDAFEEFSRQAAAQQDLQFVVSRVTQGDLAVTTA